MERSAVFRSLGSSPPAARNEQGATSLGQHRFAISGSFVVSGLDVGVRGSGLEFELRVQGLGIGKRLPNCFFLIRHPACFSLAEHTQNRESGITRSLGEGNGCAFAKTVHLNDFGTNLIHRYAFQPQHRPEFRAKISPGAATTSPHDFI